jgi:hypothetical protein
MTYWISFYRAWRDSGIKRMGAMIAATRGLWLVYTAKLEQRQRRRVIEPYADWRDL